MDFFIVFSVALLLSHIFLCFLSNFFMCQSYILRKTDFISLRATTAPFSSLQFLTTGNYIPRQRERVWKIFVEKSQINFPFQGLQDKTTYPPWLSKDVIPLPSWFPTEAIHTTLSSLYSSRQCLITSQAKTTDSACGFMQRSWDAWPIVL